jgi:hypothetical protein
MQLVFESFVKMNGDYDGKDHLFWETVSQSGRRSEKAQDRQMLGMLLARRNQNSNLEY